MGQLTRDRLDYLLGVYAYIRGLSHPEIPKTFDTIVDTAKSAPDCVMRNVLISCFKRGGIFLLLEGNSVAGIAAWQTAELTGSSEQSIGLMSIFRLLPHVNEDTANNLAREILKQMQEKGLGSIAYQPGGNIPQVALRDLLPEDTFGNTTSTLKGGGSKVGGGETVVVFSLPLARRVLDRKRPPVGSRIMNDPPLGSKPN